MISRWEMRLNCKAEEGVSSQESVPRGALGSMGVISSGSIEILGNSRQNKKQTRTIAVRP